ncbi:SMP-30/gluconolactonase/LRE family protein [Portibacter marinus]|uniref:SMP-30/gluconolactonase/LRE family protein n=1 Tax=Portibacter marinus TaxID=2898660 RepID=UPI001F3DDBB7|nr:SMP-30/gluconolactonase/LRE family protein [Portibacter marinus]
MNILHNALLLLMICFLSACAEPKSDVTEEKGDEQKTMTLVKKWETDTVFTTAESAIYDDQRDVIFVSNIENGPWEADGKGSIGKLSLSGQVVDARWITGLNAPKGLGIVGDYLYVTDLTTLLEIDIDKGEINKRYEVEGATGINDITTAPDGTVYISDSHVGKIFKLQDGNVTEINDGLAKSNGVFYEDGKLIIGTWDDEKVNTLSLSDNVLTTLAENITQPDGIEADGEGGYFVSSWKGLVHYIDPQGSSTVILDTTGDEIGAADIDFIQSEKLLLVPTFFHNTIAAYEVKMQ